MESLKSAIANNKRFEFPVRSLFWELMSAMDKEAPESIFVKRRIGAIRRAARLVFASQVTGRQIDTFDALWGQELYLIGEWFEHHKAEYAAWCLENKAAIHQAAGIVSEQE